MNQGDPAWGPSPKDPAQKPPQIHRQLRSGRAFEPPRHDSPICAAIHTDDARNGDPQLPSRARSGWRPCGLICDYADVARPPGHQQV